MGIISGVFDGQSHVVYNLYSHEGLKSENKDNNNNLYRNGLFGAIYNATVQNLGIENADIVIPMNDTSTYGKGILVDWMTNSTIKKLLYYWFHYRRFLYRKIHRWYCRIFKWEQQYQPVLFYRCNYG